MTEDIQLVNALDNNNNQTNAYCSMHHNVDEYNKPQV